MATITTLDCSVFATFLTIDKLSHDQLAISWPWYKINIFQDIIIDYYVPKLHMAGNNTLDCSVFTRVLAIAGYRLAIGWQWYKIITVEDIVMYYDVSKLHMPAVNTLDCSVFATFFCLTAGYGLAMGWLGWLWVGYWLAINYLLASYWLCIGCLSVGCQLALAQNQYTSRYRHILLGTKVAHGCTQYFGL